jgi:hypothetical protein
MSETNMENQVENEVQNEPEKVDTKTFTQDDVERIVSERLARERKKFEKKFDGVDVEEAKRLLAEKEQAELERQKERGEFEEVLKKTVAKKDEELNSYKQKLQETLVDGALLNAASKNNAVSPEQVSALLKNKVKLSDGGTVEVLDDNGTPRYNDKGELLSVNELVSDFLTANQHFVRATTGGAGSAGNAGGSTPKHQSVAEMVANWNSGGREAYAAMKKGNK